MKTFYKSILITLITSIIIGCGVEADGEILVTHRIDMSGICPEELSYNERQECYENVVDLFEKLSKEN